MNVSQPIVYKIFLSIVLTGVLGFPQLHQVLRSNLWMGCDQPFGPNSTECWIDINPHQQVIFTETEKGIETEFIYFAGPLPDFPELHEVLQNIPSVRCYPKYGPEAWMCELDLNTEYVTVLEEVSGYGIVGHTESKSR